jgi:steroid delta-isomerase-like uncharacterized protein
MSTTVTSPPVGATNAELVRWSFEMLNRHDLSALEQFWNSETVERFPDRTCHGKDEIVRYFGDAFAAIPDFHMEVQAIAEQDEHVFVHWRLTGTHQGPALGIEPTGKSLTIDGMDHFTFRDGKVISNFVVFDQMQYARQIGMMPADGSGPDKALKAAFNARTKLLAAIKR